MLDRFRALDFAFDQYNRVAVEGPLPCLARPLLLPRANSPAVTLGPGQSNGDNSGWGTLFTMILTVLIFWLIWTVFFWSFAKSDAPGALLKRLTRWLLGGSILELLVAVPSHVIVRRRDDCCAPAGTF